MQKIMGLIDQNHFVQQLRERYEQLSRRDQSALLILVIFIVIAFGYLLIWEPLSQWSDEQKQDYNQQVTASSWIQKNIQQIKEVEKKKNTGSGHRELSSVISGVAKQAGVTINRIQPDKKGVSVWLEDAAYQKALAWLVVLDTKYHVTVQQIKVDRLKEEGRVKVYIRLNGG